MLCNPVLPYLTYPACPVYLASSACPTCSDALFALPAVPALSNLPPLPCPLSSYLFMKDKCRKITCIIEPKSHQVYTNFFQPL